MASEHHLVKAAKEDSVNKGQNKGFSLIELLVVLAVIGIISTFAFINFFNFKNSPRDAAQIIYGNLLRERSAAMENTEARRLVLRANGSLEFEEALNCSASLTSWQNPRAIAFGNLDGNFVFNTFTPSSASPSLPTGDRLVVCFTSRGTSVVPTGVASGRVTASNGRYTYVIEAALGGGVRIYAQ